MSEGGAEEEGDVLDLIETIDINNSNSTSAPVSSTSTIATATNDNTHEKERSADACSSNNNNLAADVVNKSEEPGKLLRSVEDIWHNIKVSNAHTLSSCVCLCIRLYIHLGPYIIYFLTLHTDTVQTVYM